MGKKSNKKKILLKNELSSSSNNYLLGSSADTIMQNNINNNNNSNPNHHNHPNHHNDNSNQINIQKNQAYNYAILNDDIVEEAALLSSSEGYDAELDDSVYSFNSQPIDIDTIAADELESVVQNNNNINNNTNYMSTNNEINSNDSVLSEVSDSILLLQERENHLTLKWHKRPSIFMISLILFLYTFSTGISLSSELQLVLEAVCFNYNNGKMLNCSSNNIQKENANVQKWNNFISSIVKILVSTKIGKLSDIYGRKPIILLTFIMSALSKFLLIFVLQPKIFSFNYFLTSNLVDSLGGSIYVLLGSANSYTIDVVHDKDRLQALGKITGALFLGLSLGPLSSFVLSSTFKLKPIYLVGLDTFLMIISILIVIFFIPESRGLKLKDKSRRFSIRSQREMEKNPSLIYKLGLSTFIESFNSLKLFWITRPIDFKGPIDRSYSESSNEFSNLLQNSNNINNNPNSNSNQIDLIARFNVLLLLGVEILITFCMSGASMPIALYLVYTFNINQSQLGLFVGTAAGLRAIFLTICNPQIQHYLTEIFHHDSINIDFIDVTSIGLAILCELIGSLLCSCSSTVLVFCLYLIFVSVAGIASPVLHSALLKYNSSPGKNGEFFGALALIRNLINLVSPWIFLSVYSFGLGIGKPQIIFYLIFFAFAISGFLMGNLRFKTQI